MFFLASTLIVKVFRFIPKSFFTGEFLGWSVRIPAPACANIFVPVLYCKITVKWTGHTFMSAAGVILHGEDRPKVCCTWMDFNVYFLVSLSHAMLHFRRSWVRRARTPVKVHIERIIAIVGWINRDNCLMRLTENIWQTWKETAKKNKERKGKTPKIIIMVRWNSLSLDGKWGSGFCNYDDIM